MKNPWCEIPAYDYEGHMSSKDIDQLSVLSNIFKKVLERYRPQKVAVLGCATGNGFEHVDNKITHKVVGIDINSEYLEIANKRFQKHIPNLETKCLDLKDCQYSNQSFDLIHAALIFEYVDPVIIISKISLWLKRGGILSVVLQLPSEQSAPISKSNYLSIASLKKIMTLVSPDSFKLQASKNELFLVSEWKELLQQNKSFFVGIFIKN